MTLSSSFSSAVLFQFQFTCLALGNARIAVDHRFGLAQARDVLAFNNEYLAPVIFGMPDHRLDCQEPAPALQRDIELDGLPACKA